MAPKAYDVATQLLECACVALAETDEGCPDRSCVIGGQIAWDSCGSAECGQLTVAMQSSYPSSNFPTPAETTASQYGGTRCGHPIKVHSFTITILRCVPGSGPNGEPPPCEMLAAAAQIAATDAEAILYATECCLAEMYDTRDENGARLIQGWTVGTQTFLGPQGLCGGSALPVRVGVINTCNCTD